MKSPERLLQSQILFGDSLNVKESAPIFLLNSSILKTGFIVVGLLLLSLFPVNGQTKDGEIFLPETFSSPYIKITQAEVSGNKRTRDRILIRELDFALGDSLETGEGAKRLYNAGQKRISSRDSSELMRRLGYSRENIINTNLFLQVDLRLESINSVEYKLLIDVQERWYFWAFPVIKLDYPNMNDWLKDPDLGLITTGVFTSHNNLWGLSHQASLIATWGSSKALGLGYYIPWIGNGQKLGIRFGGIYNSSGVVEYGSYNNERQIMYDEGSTQEYFAWAKVTIRPGLYNYATIKLDGGYVAVSDTLYEASTNFLPDNKTSVASVNLYADYYYDSRNSKTYPLKGNYMKAFVDKKGLGMISHDVDYFYYGIDFHFYQKIGNKFYMAEMLKLSKSSSQNIAYYFKQTLTSGDDFIRGYDYYALRGDDMYYFKNNFKYELIKPSIRKAKKEKHKDSQFRNIPYAFYLNTFADAAYLVDEFGGDENPYNNKMLYSWGFGIDFISYYDLVLRFEYAFTSIGTHGFFFGFGMPI